MILLNSRTCKPASQGGEQIARIRTRAEESLRVARSRMRDVTQTAEAHARETALEVERQVRDNPWTAVGIAAGVGVLVGILLGRK